MGSILNFVFPYSISDVPNWINSGPFTNKIISNYNHSYNFELKENCENILVCETANQFKGFINNFHTPINNKSLSDFIFNNKNIKVILVSLADPCSDEEKQDIIDFININRIDSRVFYIESNFKNKKYKNTFCWHSFMDEYANHLNMIFEVNAENVLGYTSQKIQLDELDNFRNKKFLSFNRALDRKHRITFFYDYLRNDFSDSYFSFLSYFEIYKSIYYDNWEEIDYTYFNKILPIELDTHSVQSKNDFDTTLTLGKKEFYLDSCINIVTETTFNANELFISEKILKPILHYQPFIVMGSVNYLSELQKIGFKTFSNFWDESYDDIEDPTQRYQAIIKLILELNSKSIEEFNELYQKTKDICIHNNNVLYSMKSNFDDIITGIINTKL